MWPGSAKIQMVVNEEIDREIVYKRELRQENPLSSPFFVLVVDGLNRIIRKVSNARLVKGLPSGRNFVTTNL